MDALESFELGIRAQRAGRLQEAAQHFGRSARARPDDPRTWTCLGSVLQLAGRPADALRCYRRAIAIDPAYADAHCNLGTLFQGERRLEEALAAYREAQRLQPGHGGALAGIATILDWRGRHEEAVTLLDEAEAAAGGRMVDPELELVRARLLARAERAEEAMELLLRLLASEQLSDRQRQRAHFALGDIRDQRTEYDQAFEHYRTGNSLARVRFDAAAHSAFVDRVIAFFTELRSARLPRTELEDQRPVFIVGMPRSGTTLVEQILAGHTRVFAAGERTALPQLVGTLCGRAEDGGGFPEALERATRPQLEQAAHGYLETLPPPAAGALRVTDKLPGNFLYLGLIPLLFPRARIIHCTRDPLDTCFSCYAQNFGGNALPFSYDLGHIAAYYRDYQRLMAHWRELRPLPVLTVEYEELVNDAEPVVRGMLASLGLDWEPDCLRFDQLERPALTASYAQVRQGIYRSSIGRARHYDRHLEQLSLALGESAGRE